MTGSTKCGQGLGGTGIPYIDGRNVKWYNHFGKKSGNYLLKSKVCNYDMA